MAPKARNALRGPGRKASAAEATPKRGRPAAKSDTVDAAIETPKKRGRPPKVRAEEPEAAIEDAPQPKKRGRPSLHASGPEAEQDAPKKGNGKTKKETEAAEAEEEAPVPKKRGRPRKEAATQDAPITPKRGRPAKAAALDLNRVVDSRVGKRSSPRSKPTKAATAPSRQDPRMRSKLRTRLPPAKKIIEDQPAPQPARRGRPPKGAAKAAAPKKAAGSKALDAGIKKPTRPLAPRKMRGHTVRQIPDKYVAQVDQFLHGLMEADLSDESPGEDEGDGDGENQEEAQDDIDVLPEADMEPTSGAADDEGHEGGLVSSEQDREEYADVEDMEELGEGAGNDTDSQQENAQDEYEEEDEVAVAQSDQLEEQDQELSDAVDENMSSEGDGPLRELQPDVSVQGISFIEQSSEDDNVAVEANGSEDAQSGEDKENVVHETSRPSAPLIFG
ncbi:hypothetical protein P3342_008532 [Pyrenophora teres f. teres]|uniref:Uncharacterized protein n=1 Tax=Pyrenophora teres f. teres TaxID=97479 RepID=A0A6S6W615_9PLEO|nr:hypothetical protein PTNB85_07244 [Pyrenophora teres f. teres]KAE8863309.1 hypothetical protein PTNB73_06516 [Pyrenophora teres f. teres]KAK1910652.1 hypothetical protein P3342_008532 [Pyrenophora teres f. teres]CAE7186353.1 hypothetical protein PTTW11_06954 [Pyrenophora teres f. teres]